jgi:hypothetical protein
LRLQGGVTCEEVKGELRLFHLWNKVNAKLPAHLRRRASAQPAMNDAELPGTARDESSVAMPTTLHPFTAGCI